MQALGRLHWWLARAALLQLLGTQLRAGKDSLQRCTQKALTSSISALWTHASSLSSRHFTQATLFQGPSGGWVEETSIQTLACCVRHKQLSPPPRNLHQEVESSRHISPGSYGEGELEDQHIISHHIEEHAQHDRH